MVRNWEVEMVWAFACKLFICSQEALIFKTSDLVLFQRRDPSPRPLFNFQGQVYSWQVIFGRVLWTLRPKKVVFAPSLSPHRVLWQRGGRVPPFWKGGGKLKKYKGRNIDIFGLKQWEWVRMAGVVGGGPKYWHFSKWGIGNFLFLGTYRFCPAPRNYGFDSITFLIGSLN